ncbi:MAG: chemotaxis protein CheD [Defluviitaleaceae bacterium]|nr:chemotaxis protein CheD [Defluviitaleaceae bacterium]MCL2835733.1 chemotaxis protein CheD [Defluviitaleaceae bacterium]
MNIKQMIIVGMADLNACKSPGVLTTLGLGSCVGIALYDPLSKVAGLAHCMLPDSTKIQNNNVEAKFVDTAVAKLLMQMQKMGANKRMIKAKVAGGAQMFAFNATNDMMRIGDRNVEATTKVLGQHGIPILAKDVGLTYGRTVELYAETGAFLIKTIGHGNKTL